MKARKWPDAGSTFHADWTTPAWVGVVMERGYANINYSLQVTLGGLITIG